MNEWTVEGRCAAVDAILMQAPVLPVLAIADVEDALPLARALLAGGLPVLEITLRSEAALEAMRRIATEVAGAVVGAGTVLEAAQLDASIASGACFAISPGATEALYAAAESAPIPWLPAVATASELMRGIERGHRRFKFFPAEAAGGVPALQGLAGPFPQVRFCPTGGIDGRTVERYRALPNVITVGGSWMVPRDRLAARDWSAIERLAAEAAGRG